MKLFRFEWGELPDGDLRGGETAEEAFDRGEFALALALSEGVPGVRGELVRLMVWLSTADGARAAESARLIDEMAGLDAFSLAVNDLAQGLNRFRNADLGLAVEDRDRVTMVLLEGAAEQLLGLGEMRLAMRAWTALAHVQFINGRFFAAVNTVERAWGFGREHGLWFFGGRLLGLSTGMAVDQGYRIGMRELLEKALRWCERVGDVEGHIEVLMRIGLLTGYEIPSGVPELAAEPDSYLVQAAEEAGALGLNWVAGDIDSKRAWLYEKVGNEAESRRILGEDVANKGARERNAELSAQEADRVEDAIRLANAARLYNGIDKGLDAFFVFDTLRDDLGVCRDFNCVYANLEGKRIYAKSPHELYLFSEAQRLTPLQGLEDAFVAAVDLKETREDLFEAVLPEGSKWYLRRTMPSVKGLVLSVRDVTAEKSIERALREAAESSARSEKAKSAFLASMSHEIRTPLNGVLGLARMLSETDLNPTQRAYVDDIILSGDLLLDLIGDVLDLSKIESEEMGLTSTPVSLTETLEAIVKLFRGQAQERGTTLGFELTAGAPETVLADGVRLRQILSNLVGNAVKFTTGGAVSLRVLRDQEMVVFEVRDTGIGIPQDQIGNVFQRFQQAGDAAYGGSGLGLTITKALVELMGGDVVAESEVGRGSVFRVRLPLREASTPIVPSGAGSGLWFEGARVLLVEDNRINMLVASYALEKFGCVVVCAEDGARGVEAFESEPFDLVLMDVMMPVMDGLEATRAMRALGGTMPIVALTAGALLQEREDCLRAGMDDFATKPITPESIGQILARWLPASPL